MLSPYFLQEQLHILPHLFSVFTEIISDHSSDSVKSGCMVRFIVQVLSRRSQANKPHSIVLITLHLILSKRYKVCITNAPSWITYVSQKNLKVDYSY